MFMINLTKEVNMTNQNNLALENSGASKNTLQTATQILEALQAGQTPPVTEDARAMQLALRGMRLKLLEELATFQDLHLLAFMNVLCEKLAETGTMSELLNRLTAETNSLLLHKSDKVSWMLSFTKLCQARLSGNINGLRLI